jgi:hypothetical protein
MKERLLARVFVVLTTCNATWASNLNEIEIPTALELRKISSP